LTGFFEAGIGIDFDKPGMAKLVNHEIVAKYLETEFTVGEV
jgi:hypothetical protein